MRQADWGSYLEALRKSCSLLIRHFLVSGVSTPYKKCDSAVLGTAETLSGLGEDPSFTSTKPKKNCEEIA